MKRLLVALACVAALAVVPAGAAGNSATWHVDLRIDQSALMSDASLTLEATLFAPGPGWSVQGKTIGLWKYTDSSCTEGVLLNADAENTRTNSHGVYTYTFQLYDATSGQVWFQAKAWGEGLLAESECIPLVFEEPTAPFSVTLAADPTSLKVGEPTTLSGVVTAGEEPVADAEVALGAYRNAECTGVGQNLTEDEPVVTGRDGTYALGGLYTDEAATWWFQASVTPSTEAEPVVSECVSVTWTAEEAKPVEPVEPVEPAIPSSYLCWNHEMTDPVAYADSVADTMWATGNYFEPQAILGNVVGGTNIGAYHLVCNTPSTLKPTGYGLGSSGEVYSPEVMALYHHDHVLNVNDLNLYHIYG